MVQANLFLKKRLWNFETLKKNFLLLWHKRVPSFRRKNHKIKKKCFIFQKIILFLLKYDFYKFLAFFEVYDICFAQNVQILIFLGMTFQLITTFILWHLAPKKVIKGDYFGFLWRPEDQIIYLRSNFWHLEVFWKLLRALHCLGPKPS